MNSKLQNIVRCVYDDSALQLRCFDKRFSTHGNELVVNGSLVCSRCGREYPIIDEIAFIAEDELLANLPKVQQFRLASLAQIQPIEKGAVRNLHVLQEVQLFWSERPSAGKWDDEIEQMEGLEKWRIVTHPWLESLAEYDQHSGELMLEVGGGQGLCTYRFAQGRARIVSLDLSYDSLLIAQRRVRRKGLADYVDFVVGNAENLPFRDNQFYYVYSHGVVHHSNNTRKCVKEIHRVTANGAKVVIMYYYTWSLTKLVEGTAKVTYKVLKKITGREDAFLKLAGTFLKMYKDKAFLNFLKTGKSATLHAPIIRTFSKGESFEMFSEAGFCDIQMTLRHLSEEIAFILQKTGLGFMIPWFESRFGWDLIITSKKRS